MPVFSWMPGADKYSIAERELQNQDLNATRDGFADRVGAWNWQDSFGAWLAGTTKEEVLELATKKANKELEQKLQPVADRNASKLGPLQATYTGVKGKTPERLQQELETDTARVTALENEIATNPKFRPETLSPTATTGQIYGSSATAKQTAADTKEENEKAERLAETKRQEYRQDRIAEVARLDRLAQQKSELELRRDNIQFEYARLAQADREKAQDRKDKAFMMLLQGLGNLGTAFTI